MKGSFREEASFHSQNAPCSTCKTVRVNVDNNIYLLDLSFIGCLRASRKGATCIRGCLHAHVHKHMVWLEPTAEKALLKAPGPTTGSGCRAARLLSLSSLYRLAYAPIISITYLSSAQKETHSYESGFGQLPIVCHGF